MDHSTMDMGMQHVVAAAGGFDYGLAFMAGVLGSGHCLGMCGQWHSFSPKTLNIYKPMIYKDCCIF
jgi:hypothetical protein